MSDTIEIKEAKTSKRWDRVLQTGNIPKPTVAHLPSREAANKPKAETPATPAPQITPVVTETIPEQPLAAITETPTPEGIIPSAQELPKKVIVTPDTILVDEKGNSVSVREAQFFGYKKENWDRAATAIKQTRDELATERARIEAEANSPLLRTARAIRQANPEFSEDQVQQATFGALGYSATPEGKKEDIKPPPTPPSGFAPGDPEWTEYERAEKQWMLDEIDRRTEARIKPLMDTVETGRKQTESEKKAQELFVRNESVIKSRYDHLPFDTSNLTPEQQQEIDSRIVDKAASYGMYLDSQSLAAKEINSDMFKLVVESLYPPGSSAPGTNPAEILAAKLNSGAPLVEKASPKPPPAPGLQQTQIPDKPNPVARNRKDDWYQKLNNGA